VANRLEPKVTYFLTKSSWLKGSLLWFLRIWMKKSILSI
jgi:hypothetical protein